MTKDTLNQLSKDALEELGRTKGVELDKRFNKAKLVTAIAALFKKEEKAKEFHKDDANKDGVVDAKEAARAALLRAIDNGDI